MAKNASRKSANSNAGKAKKETESQRAARELQKAAASESKREVIYQVKTRRDSDVIKAYITFHYRAFHPGVTTRLIFFGILIALPAIIVSQTWLKVLCVVVGGILILLGFFRQYISLALTKRNDEAYKNGTVFTYDFTMNDVRVYSDDALTSYISKYKEIISFFYDDDYYYIGVRNRDFFILPKSRFTKGDPAEFEDFIYKRSKKTCKWLPSKFSDRMKLRRAYRAMQAEEDLKKDS